MHYLISIYLYLLFSFHSLLYLFSLDNFSLLSGEIYWVDRIQLCQMIISTRLLKKMVSLRSILALSLPGDRTVIPR